MNGKILDLRDFDRVEFAPCKGLFCIDEHKSPRIIHTRVVTVNELGQIGVFYLFDEIDDDLNNVTLAVRSDRALNYYSMFWLASMLDVDFRGGFLFDDSEVEPCARIEEVVMPLIHSGVAVSSEVLDFMDKPLTLELLRETFADRDFSWNETNNKDSEND